MLETLTWLDLLIMSLGLIVAYIVFGISGFGTALVASPLLALFISVDTIVPLLALLDCSAAIANVSRDYRAANLGEVKRLLPMMIIGSLLGAAILLTTRGDALLLLLGLFVVTYALYALSGFKSHQQWSEKAATPFGLVGGVFSALFGSGGFLYAIYLSGRIVDKNGIRVTQSTLIGFSTLTRVIIFLLAGVYMNIDFLLLTLLLLPAMLIGITLGRRITLKLSREQFLKVVQVVILCSGIVLVVRYFYL